MKIQAIDNTLSILSERDDKYAKGAVALLLKLRVEANEQLSLCTQLFSIRKQKTLFTEENDENDDSSDD